ncbi:S41 family peptidase [Sinomicrobium soli]|uniref:S41 family peptidase n=1 Tax=Sinomicrobium sp. N-1-3-6 TaxID=2219864 RepID=UPI000DCD30B1|nr:S41 family peptidase [Sinomicrobium sp. N-1-3-6]RAV28078.1 hypothetical protein DN748_15370 [Sinomicrobium sp. N-1-3-6]
MNKLFLSFLMAIFCAQGVIAQEQLGATEKLASTARIWGFLKYYHPNVADGAYNWDEELFKILPRVKQATDKEALSEVYLEWIESLGQVKPCEQCKANKEGVLYFDKNFDLNWLDDEQLFTKELSEKLRYVEENRHQGEKYYAKTREGVGGGALAVENEIDYEDFDWNNENLRLLSLFRYWNIVEYFFPYKYQMDTDWDVTLSEMIPRFLNPESEEDFSLAMLELVISIDDSHANLFTKGTLKYFGRYYPPFGIKLFDDGAVVTEILNDSLAKSDDIKIGDIITEVSNRNIGDVFEERKKYIAGSNISRKRFNAKYYIFNGSDDSLNLTYIRNGKKQEKTIKRHLNKDIWGAEKSDNKKEAYKIFDGNIAYVDLALLKDIKIQDMMETLKNTRAIIIDTRESSSASIYDIVNYITSPEKEYFKIILPDFDYPGRFFWMEEGLGKGGSNKKLQYEGKVVVLVNERCQSQCEFRVMCLQTGNNVTTIGSQTSGADGNVSRFNIVGGVETQITGVGIFYPDGTETQRKGVKIDIEVEPTLQGTANGEDEILEQAIEFAKQ